MRVFGGVGTCRDGYIERVRGSGIDTEMSVDLRTGECMSSAFILEKSSLL